MRFNQRKTNGQFGRMSITELGLVKENELARGSMICSKCGHKWYPILITGKCPKCGYQRKN